MKHCSREVHWAFFASGGIKKHRAVKVVPVRETLAEGAAPLRGNRLGEIVEWHDPEGCVLARKVSACDTTEYWLRSDLADECEAIVAAEAAEVERVKAEVLAYAAATRRQGGQETYVLSSALLHAATRRQARIGRLYDMNSRGDRVRGNLAAALKRSHKAGV